MPRKKDVLETSGVINCPICKKVLRCGYKDGLVFLVNETRVKRVERSKAAANRRRVEESYAPD